MKKSKSKEKVDRPIILEVLDEVKSVKSIANYLICVTGAGNIHIYNESYKEILKEKFSDEPLLHCECISCPFTENILIIIQTKGGDFIIFIFDSEILIKINEFSTNVSTFCKFCITKNGINNEITNGEELSKLNIGLSNNLGDVEIRCLQGEEKGILKANPFIKSVAPLTLPKPTIGEGLRYGLVSAINCVGYIYIIGGYESGYICIWDVSIPEQIIIPYLALQEEIKQEGNSHILSLLSNKLEIPNAIRIYIGTFQTQIAIIDFSIDQRLITSSLMVSNICSELKPGISDIKLRDDSKIWFTSSYDFRVRAYSTKSNKLLALFKFHTKNINSVSLKDNLIFVGSDDGFITIWQVY